MNEFMCESVFVGVQAERKDVSIQYCYILSLYGLQCSIIVCVPLPSMNNNYDEVIFAA